MTSERSADMQRDSMLEIAKADCQGKRVVGERTGAKSNARGIQRLVVVREQQPG